MTFRKALTLYNRAGVVLITAFILTLLMTFANGFIPLILPAITFSIFIVGFIIAFALSIYISSKYGKVEKYKKFLPIYKEQPYQMNTRSIDDSFTANEQCTTTDINYSSIPGNIYHRHS